MLEKLANQLKTEEGLRLEVYLDHLGNPTVGYGCRVAVGDKINLETAEALFNFRLAQTIDDFYKIPRELTKHLNEARKRVICQMIYQLGLSGTLGFHLMWDAIRVSDFQSAAAEMLDSKWARQTPSRVFRLARQMEAG